MELAAVQSGSGLEIDLEMLVFCKQSINQILKHIFYLFNNPVSAQVNQYVILREAVVALPILHSFVRS